MIHVHISPFHAFFIHYLFEIHRSRGEKTREDMVLPLDLKYHLTNLLHGLNGEPNSIPKYRLLGKKQVNATT